MKPNRLVMLLVLAVVLAVARFAFPPKPAEYAIAEPLVRGVIAEPSKAVTAQSGQRTQVAKAGVEEVDVPGNAFAVRVVPAPPVTAPASPPPPVLPAVPIAATPPIPPPPPPPPLQVIGTYDDGGPPAVFVATPTGTLIARPGSVLLAEYRVTGITPQQVALTQISNQRTLQLAVPSGVSR